MKRKVRYKGKVYAIERPVMMKHPVTRKWIEAIAYSEWDNPRIHYVRERHEFEKNYEPVSEVPQDGPEIEQW